MTRDEIVANIRQTLGSSPDWLTQFPDQILEHIWASVRDFQLGQTAIPNKYKELMGLAVAAQMQCAYCVYFHREAAKFWGASETEIEEALAMALMTAGLSSYIAGSGYDLNKFKQETDTVLEYVKAQSQQQKQRVA
ncbi:MAG: carboxymuconolactone decarboxylase family protein [Chloroflexota bacterium]